MDSSIGSVFWKMVTHFLCLQGSARALLLSIFCAWIVLLTVVDSLALQSLMCAGPSPHSPPSQNPVFALHKLQTFSYKCQLHLIHLWSPNTSLLIHLLAKQNWSEKPLHLCNCRSKSSESITDPVHIHPEGMDVSSTHLPVHHWLVRLC